MEKSFGCYFHVRSSGPSAVSEQLENTYSCIHKVIVTDQVLENIYSCVHKVIDQVLESQKKKDKNQLPPVFISVKTVKTSSSD